LKSIKIRSQISTGLSGRLTDRLRRERVVQDALVDVDEHGAVVVRVVLAELRGGARNLRSMLLFFKYFTEIYEGKKIIKVSTTLLIITLVFKKKF
jgi:hypothetical protein